MEGFTNAMQIRAFKGIRSVTCWPWFSLCIRIPKTQITFSFKNHCVIQRLVELFGIANDQYWLTTKTEAASGRRLVFSRTITSESRSQNDNKAILYGQIVSFKMSKMQIDTEFPLHYCTFHGLPAVEKLIRDATPEKLNLQDNYGNLFSI